MRSCCSISSIRASLVSLIFRSSVSTFDSSDASRSLSACHTRSDRAQCNNGVIAYLQALLGDRQRRVLRVCVQRSLEGLYLLDVCLLIFSRCLYTKTSAS
jgi:hypothetical protein